MSCGCRNNRGQSSRRSYGRVDWTPEKIEAAYSQGLISQEKYLALKNPPKSDGMSTGQMVGIAALIGAAALSMRGRNKK